MAILGKRKRGGRSHAGQGRKKKPRRSAAAGGYGKFAVAKATYSLTGLNGSDATPGQGLGLGFKVSDMQGSASLLAAFDEYRINAVKVTFRASYNPSTAGTNVAKLLPLMWYCSDRNDVTAPTASTDVTRQAQAKSFQFNDNRTIKTVYLKPNTLDDNSSAWGRWMSCSGAPSEVYYGLKTWFDYLQTGQGIKVDVKYYCEFRGVRA